MPRASSDWPPDYVAEYARRQRVLLRTRGNANLELGAREYYLHRPVEFITDWCLTYDPRNAKTRLPTRMPFVLFPRQRDLVTFLMACLSGKADGLIEKCRDMGATWVCCAFSVWLLLFWPGAAIGWGSRKEQLVDKLGDPDSIFEKMRLIIGSLPAFFLPAGFNPRDHMTYMRIVNPENGATITGEAGDNIGRGGRKSIYFVDEAAHLERPEKIEAALGDNTDVRVDVSSVHGTGNPFHRKREAGAEWAGGFVYPDRANVFVMDWRDHPGKDQAWYDKRRKKAEEAGMLHIFAQEVERNYASAVEGVVIPPEWVEAAVDAHIKLGLDMTGGRLAGFDVADSGGDKNALAIRNGVIIEAVDEWGDRDPGKAARRVLAQRGLTVQYDCIGVGATVKAEVNRLADESDTPAEITMVPWNAGAAVLDPEAPVNKGDPDSPTNKDFFANLKAQGWWELRRRFERTYQAVVAGVGHPADQMISISSDIKHLHTLKKELSQPTMGQSGRLKMLINKTPDGTKSPNIGDAVMMCFWPIPEDTTLADLLALAAA